MIINAVNGDLGQFAIPYPRFTDMCQSLYIYQVLRRRSPRFRVAS
nr:MAG TPA: hypothetical protein [Microviridae sp.]